MAHVGKRSRAARALFEGKANLSVEEAVKLIKSAASAKFDETVEIAMNLGVDPRHADQMVRGMVTLPSGTGKDVKVAVFARGDKAEEAFRQASSRFPNQVRVVLGFDEGLAHRIEAGADIFLMPSRFEPSGLNQLYSLRYGTPPVVRRTGGLADSIVDASPESVALGRANGFVFDDYTPETVVGRENFPLLGFLYAIGFQPGERLAFVKRLG